MSSKICIFLQFLIKTIVCTENLVHVTTSRGQLIGYHADFGNDTKNLYYGKADLFLGIPYVKPPVGELRFKRPQKFDSFWQQPWNATMYRPKCPQYENDYSGVDEDCLYLNIFTPNSTSTFKYPVLLWIHGGALVTGSALSYNPKGAVRNLVSRDVIVVTIQYRLGLLGFFTTGTADFPPNLGMLDQVEAMRFVREEIGNFGGDSNKISIFGESAGGGSVSAHTYSPLSRGLFQQAIMQSGAVWTSLDHTSTDILYLSLSRAESLCNFTQRLWDTKNFTPLHDCLSTMDYHNFLPYEQYNMIGWKIVIDDYFMPDFPRNLYKQIKQRANIPILLGSNKDEWALFEMTLIEQNRRNFTDFNSTIIAENLHDYAPHLLPVYPNLPQILTNIYSNDENNQSDHLYWLKSITNIFSGAFFTAFMGREVDYYLDNNNTNVFLYEFTWPSTLFGDIFPGWQPVFHSLELAYLWMPEYLWVLANSTDADMAKDLEIADILGESWTNFAKFGAPLNNWTSVVNRDIKEYRGKGMGIQPPTPLSQPLAKILIKKENFQLFGFFSSTLYYEIGGNRGMRQGYRLVDQYVWNRIVPELVGSWPVERNVSDLYSSVPPNILSSTTTKSKAIRNKIFNFFLFISLLNKIFT